MNSFFNRALAVAAVSVVLFACPAPPLKCDPEVDDCDDGGVPPDICNSAVEATTNPLCKAVVGEGCPAARMGQDAGIIYGGITTLLDGGRDTDYYFAQLPDGLNARCLLHVSAGYSVPQTAVNLSVNVLKEDQTQSIMAGIDRHGAAAPKFVDLITPFTQSGAKIFVQLADEAATVQNKVDNRNQYSLRIEVSENPDPNEPNETTATAIPLTASGDGVEGKSFGYLATADDVDTYSFDVASGGRQIIYLAITSPTANLQPPVPYKLSYSLLDPTGVQISEGVMENEFLQIDLRTARLLTKPGTCKLIIKGYKPDGSTASVLGDLRLRYDVDVRVIPDLDMREPNDGVDTAQTINLINGLTQIKGRIAYVADEEWFKFVVPPSGTARTLRYEITVAMGGGRFPPLSAVATRQARLVTQVNTGMTAQDRKTNCKNDPTVCPRSFADINSSEGQLVGELCGVADPPQCLWGERNEEAQIGGFKDLQNFVGAVPVPNAGTTYFLSFRDQGARLVKYADDREWTMNIVLVDDPDEQSRAGGPAVYTLGSSALDAPGAISFGYGLVLDPFNLNSGQGVRGPNDYDAYETDKDLFQFNYPAGAMGDQLWGLQWIINNNTDGGRAPGDIALEVTLCGTASGGDGGFCGAQSRFIYGATLGAITPWYLPTLEANRRILFTKMVTPATTVFTATPESCTCFAGSKVSPAGKFYVNVTGVNRVSNDPIQYTLRQTVATYPNGNPNCPVTDGGCKFAGQ